MPAPGDVIGVDFGVPLGGEAGHSRPAVIVTAAEIMAYEPRTFQVVPLTTSRRDWATEVDVEADGLTAASVAQCHLLTTVPIQRMIDVGHYGNVGPVALAQIRAVLADMLDI